MVAAHSRGIHTPAQQITTAPSHSPHGSHTSAFSAGPSPSTSSPTGSNSLTKIVVAQVYLLLSTIKEDKDRTKWEQQAEQLRKVRSIARRALATPRPTSPPPDANLLPL